MRLGQDGVRLALYQGEREHVKKVGVHRVDVIFLKGFIIKMDYSLPGGGVAIVRNSQRLEYFRVFHLEGLGQRGGGAQGFQGPVVDPGFGINPVYLIIFLMKGVVAYLVKYIDTNEYAAPGPDK